MRDTAQICNVISVQAGGPAYGPAHTPEEWAVPYPSALSLNAQTISLTCNALSINANVFPTANANASGWLTSNDYARFNLVTDNVSGITLTTANGATYVKKVQPDWAQVFPHMPDYIMNKPQLANAGNLGLMSGDTFEWSERLRANVFCVATDTIDFITGNVVGVTEPRIGIRTADPRRQFQVAGSRGGEVFATNSAMAAGSSRFLGLNSGNGTAPPTVVWSNVGPLTFATLDDLSSNATVSRMQLSTDGVLTCNRVDASVDWSRVTSQPETYAPSAHQHSMSDITNPSIDWNNVTNKPEVGNGAHTHTLSNITDIDDITVPWGSVTSTPATFPPSAHTHTLSNITDIGSVLVPWTNVTGKPSVLQDGTNVAMGGAVVGEMGFGSASASGFALASQATTTSYAMLQGSDRSTYFNAPLGKKMYLRNNNTDVCTVAGLSTGGGRLGVGTTAPLYKLDVADTSRVSTWVMGDAGFGAARPVIAHQDVFSSQSYALSQSNAGHTKLNSKSGQKLSLCVNDLEYCRVDTNGFYTVADMYICGYTTMIGSLFISGLIELGAGKYKADGNEGKIGLEIWTSDMLDIVGGNTSYNRRWVRIYDRLQADQFAMSDKRLKKNIKPKGRMIDRLGDARAVTYEWREEHEQDQGVASKAGGKVIQGTQLGLLAQDIQAIDPLAVQEVTGGALLYSQSALNAILLQCVKDLKEDVSDLQKVLSDLKSVVADQQKVLSDLRAEVAKLKLK